MSVAKILIAGDLVPTQLNYDLFEKGTAQEILGKELAAKWEKADVRIANLEAPVADKGRPILKSGPNLSFPARCASGFKELNINLFGLANNHIMDFGEEGLKDTIDLLKKYEIGFVGAGANVRDAENGEIINIKGINIGIYACSEHEFSAAETDRPGANAIGVNTCLKINELKKRTDYLIVLFHGGKEHYPYPTPKQQERCHCFVDAGADLVICQHSHCIGCEEKYAGSTIVYGQGNFIFDFKNEECWQTGLLIEAGIESDSKQGSVRYYPICKDGNKIRGCDKAAEIMGQFYSRSQEIHRIDELYTKIASEDGPYMLRKLFGWNRWMRGMDRFVFGGRLVRHQSKRRALTSLGVLKCETHLELANKFLEEYL